MKVLLLAGLTSAHTIKWANSLDESGIDVSVAGLVNFERNHFNKSIKTFSFNIPKEIPAKGFGSLSKIVYLKALPELRKLINSIQPDILHSHIASSYGLLGALTNFRPYIVSVWGFDVYTFPNVSFIHKNVLRWVLKKADVVLSTSKVMAYETRKYSLKEVFVTPFGIDTAKFKPISQKEDESTTIGTIKGLEDQYGIEYLLKAYAILRERHPKEKMKLLIVGGGSKANYLRHLAKDLRIEDTTVFTGNIPYEKVIDYHNKLDIYIAVSINDNESFGVSILEASACEKPVIVSSVGGLNEVVMEGITGLVVPPKDEIATANAIEKFILDANLRKKMGQAGRRFVQENYELDKNVQSMIQIYESVVKKGR